MEALDGNAIAGPMFEYFGNEMTAADGACMYCGDTHQIAELRVYNRAPGAVVRCPSCGNVVMVLVNIRNTVRAAMPGFKLNKPGGEATPSG